MDKLPKEREYLVLDNLNMVHYVLNKQMHIHPSNPDYEDYYQEGVIGLIQAAIRFDESKGFQFSTFAFPTICGKIQRYRRDVIPLVKYPRKITSFIFQVIRYTNQGYSYSEIEELTGITQEDIQDALNVSNVISINQDIHLKDDSSSVSVIDTIVSPTNDYEELLSEEHIFQVIQKVSSSFENETYIGIWEEYIYSLFYGEKLSQKYFAEKYGICQPQVSRILKKFKKVFIKELQGG